jgi:hypothetical protein
MGVGKDVKVAKKLAAENALRALRDDTELAARLLAYHNVATAAN